MASRNICDIRGMVFGEMVLHGYVIDLEVSKNGGRYFVRCW